MSNPFATSATTAINPTRRVKTRVRVEPIVSIENGENTGSYARIDPLHDDSCLFRVSAAGDITYTASHWCMAAIEAVTDLLQSDYDRSLPIHIPFPLAGLEDPRMQERLTECFANLGQSPQDFRFCVPDAAIYPDTEHYMELLSDMARCGFRMAIDIRNSWQSPISSEMRQVFDAVIMTASQMITRGDEVKSAKLDFMRSSNMEITIDKAAWRDMPALQRRGATNVIAPKADA